MQEELHINLKGPGSSPGRVFADTVAQLVERQTRSRVLFLQPLSPQVTPGKRARNQVY